MNRRSATFAVAALLLAGMIFTVARLPVPYVVYVPGPVTDTLGNIPTGEGADGETGPVIQVSGTKTQPTDGHLYMTTVGIIPGSCDSHPTMYQAIKAWFSKSETVVPQQVQCPPGESNAAVQQQGIQEMSDSQFNAVYAALTELGYKPTGDGVYIDSVTAGVPAATVLQAGDRVLSANGTRIAHEQQLINLVHAVTPGNPLTLVIDRAGTDHTFTIKTTKAPDGTTRLGVTLSIRPTFNGINVTIGIDPDVVQGPSAGTALALGIIDKLTPGGLTGGRTIAGTGTISRLGKVGPIGGIQQKIAGAVKAGASVFFAPASECADAKAVAPSSLTLVSITTLHGAVQALEAIKAGSSAFPHC